MRKFIIIITLIVFGFALQAQMPAPMFALSTYSKTSDTCTDTETLYMYLPELPYMADLAIQPYVTNVSGTMTGYAYLQARVGYLNDSSWVTQTSNNNPDILAASQTLTLGNTASTIWYIKNRASRYRVKFAATGTAVDKIYALYMAKSPSSRGLAVADLALSTYSKTSDTLAASNTLYMTLPIVPGDYYMGIAPLFRRFSGTARTGNCYLQASLGLTSSAAVWVTQNVSTNDAMTATNDTLTLAAAQASATWFMSSYAYRYRVCFASSTGTQSDLIKAAYFLKPKRY